MDGKRKRKSGLDRKNAARRLILPWTLESVVWRINFKPDVRCRLNKVMDRKIKNMPRIWTYMKVSPM